MKNLLNYKLLQLVSLIFLTVGCFEEASPEAKADTAKLRGELSTKEAEISKLKSEVSLLKQKLSVGHDDSELKEKEEKIAKLDEEIKDLNSRLKSFIKSDSDKSQELKNNTAKINALSKKETELNVELARLKQLLLEKENKIKDLERPDAQKAQLVADILQLKAQIQNKDEDIKKLVDEKAKLQTQNKSAIETQQEKEKELSLANKTLQDERQTRLELSLKVGSLNKQLEEANKDLKRAHIEKSLAETKAAIAVAKKVSDADKIAALINTAFADAEPSKIDPNLVEDAAKQLVSLKFPFFVKTLQKLTSQSRDILKNQLSLKLHDKIFISDAKKIIENPKCSIYDTEFKELTHDDYTSLAYQIKFASSVENSTFVHNLLTQKNNNLPLLSLLIDALKADRPAQIDFTNPEIVASIHNALSKSSDPQKYQKDFLEALVNNGQIALGLEKSADLGIDDSSIKSDDFNWTGLSADNFTLLEYGYHKLKANENTKPIKGLVKNFREKFSDDEWEVELLKTFRYSRNDQLDFVSTEMSSHNFFKSNMQKTRQILFINKLNEFNGNYQEKLNQYLEYDLKNPKNLLIKLKKFALFIQDSDIEPMLEFVKNIIPESKSKSKSNSKLHDFFVAKLDEYIKNLTTP